MYTAGVVIYMCSWNASAACCRLDVFGVAQGSGVNSRIERVHLPPSCRLTTNNTGPPTTRVHRPRAHCPRAHRVLRVSGPQGGAVQAACRYLGLGNVASTPCSMKKFTASLTFQWCACTVSAVRSGARKDLQGLSPHL